MDLLHIQLQLSNPLVFYYIDCTLACTDAILLLFRLYSLSIAPDTRAMWASLRLVALREYNSSHFLIIYG